MSAYDHEIAFQDWGIRGISDAVAHYVVESALTCFATVRMTVSHFRCLDHLNKFRSLALSLIMSWAMCSAIALIAVTISRRCSSKDFAFMNPHTGSLGGTVVKDKE